MFNRDLFFSLCEKYGIELSETATSPMIRDGSTVHAITDDDVNRIFSPCQTYFGYSDNKIRTKTVAPEFYLMDNYAIAC